MARIIIIMQAIFIDFQHIDLNKNYMILIVGKKLKIKTSLLSLKGVK